VLLTPACLAALDGAAAAEVRVCNCHQNTMLQSPSRNTIDLSAQLCFQADTGACLPLLLLLLQKILDTPEKLAYMKVSHFLAVFEIS
jgi:hypothetical protein